MKIRYYSYYLPIALFLLSLSSAGLTFSSLQKAEQNKLQSIFHESTKAWVKTIEQRFYSSRSALNFIRNGCSLIPQLQLQQLTTLARPPLKIHKAFHAVAWVPRIPHEQRSVYEKRVQEQGVPHFSITASRKSDGHIVRDENREEYFPIYYIEPLNDNKKQLGLNLGSNPLWRASITLAMESGATIPTAPITLFSSETEENKGNFFFLFAPLYEQLTTESTTERRTRFRGVILGKIGFTSLIDEALTSHKETNYDFWLYDTTESDHLIHFKNFSGSPLEISPASRTAQTPDTLTASYPHPYVENHTIIFGGRHYSMVFAADQQLVNTYLTNTPGVVACLVLTLSSLFSLFILLQTRNQKNIEQQVAQRTRQLQESETRFRNLAQTMEKSEKQLKDLLANIQMGVVIIDSSTHRIVFINKTAADMIGLPPESVKGLICHTFICPAEQGRCPFDDLLETIDNSERILLRHDGSELSILKTVKRIMYKGKNCLLESFVDISSLLTARQQNETYLLELEKNRKVLLSMMEDANDERNKAIEANKELVRVKRAIDGSSDAIAMATSNGQHFYQNATFTRLFGYDINEMKDLDPYALYVDKDMAESFSKNLLHGQSWQGEAEMTRKDGRLLSVAIRADAILDENNKVTSLIWVQRDITNRKMREKRERALNELQKKLFRPAPLENKLKQITDGVISMVHADFCRIWLIKDGDLCDQGCIHASTPPANPGFCNRGHCLHLISSSGRYTHTDNEPHRRVPFGAYKIGRIASGEQDRFLTTSVTTDPRVHNHQWAKDLGLVSFAGYKLLNGDGDCIGVLALFTQYKIGTEVDYFLDGVAYLSSQIVLLSQAEEHLQTSLLEKDEANRQLAQQTKLAKQMAAEAELATVAKGDFLANMSHEIRTPLNGIIGMNGLLLNTSLDAQQLRFAQITRTSAKTLLNIINEILDFSKIEAGRMKLESTYCSIHTILNELTAIMDFTAREKGIQLLCEIDSKIPDNLKGDPTRLRQIFTNLIGNSIKFTQKGEVKIEVRLTSETQTYVTLYCSVTDSGIGISPSEQKKLFAKFSQVDTSTTRKYGGSGLGLAICKELVELMDGEIGVDSHIGEGSKFWFSVTLVKSEKYPEQEQHLALPLLEKQLPAENNFRLLLVDDDDINRMVAMGILERLNIYVQTANDGQQAITMLEEDAFDLILMDIQMPGIDGYETTRRIRKKNKKIPIIALSAHTSQEYRDKSLAAGMNDTLSKPIIANKLLEMVQSWM